jgi:Arc/MetJ family transcription regulator
MRITIEIPENLILEIMKLTGTKTKNQAIKEALESQIKLIKRKRLISMKGTVDLEIDLDTLRDRN